MKKVLLAALALCLLQFIGNAQTVQQPEKSSQKCVNFQTKCKKKIVSCTKRAKYYQKQAAKAEQKGNKDLAAVYTKCAAAKQKMADGMKKVYENSQTCQKICSQNPEIKSALKGVMGQRKKKMRMTTHMKNMQKCVDMCLQNAKSNPDLAKQYNELAAAMQAKADGFKAAAEGKKEFKAARKELKALKAASKKKEAAKTE